MAASGGRPIATLTWVDWFNTRRLLEPIGYVPPAEYEAHYYEQLRRPATIEDGVAAGIPACTDRRSSLLGHPMKSSFRPSTLNSPSFPDYGVALDGILAQLHVPRAGRRAPARLSTSVDQTGLTHTNRSPIDPGHFILSQNAQFEGAAIGAVLRVGGYVTAAIVLQHRRSAPSVLWDHLCDGLSHTLARRVRVDASAIVPRETDVSTVARHRNSLGAESIPDGSKRKAGDPESPKQTTPGKDLAHSLSTTRLSFNI